MLLTKLFILVFDLLANLKDKFTVFCDLVNALEFYNKLLWYLSFSSWKQNYLLLKSIIAIVLQSYFHRKLGNMFLYLMVQNGQKNSEHNPMNSHCRLLRNWFLINYICFWLKHIVYTNKLLAILGLFVLILTKYFPRLPGLNICAITLFLLMH